MIEKYSNLINQAKNILEMAQSGDVLYIELSEYVGKHMSMLKSYLDRGLYKNKSDSDMEFVEKYLELYKEYETLLNPDTGLEIDITANLHGKITEDVSYEVLEKIDLCNDLGKVILILMKIHFTTVLKSDKIINKIEEIVKSRS